LLGSRSLVELVDHIRNIEVGRLHPLVLIVDVVVGVLLGVVLRVALGYVLRELLAELLPMSLIVVSTQFIVDGSLIIIPPLASVAPILLFDGASLEDPCHMFGMVVRVPTVIVVSGLVDVGDAAVDVEDPLDHPDGVLALEEPPFNAEDLVVVDLPRRDHSSFKQPRIMSIILRMAELNLEDLVGEDIGEVEGLVGAADHVINFFAIFETFHVSADEVISLVGAFDFKIFISIIILYE